MSQKKRLAALVTGEPENSGINQHPLCSEITNGTQTIRADLIGSTTCTAAGITATGNAPVLALCRQLLAAGLDPDQALEVYRGATLSLTVRSIGEGAQLTVRESTSDGRPRFVRLNGDVGPPMRQIERAEQESLRTVLDQWGVA